MDLFDHQNGRYFLDAKRDGGYLAVVSFGNHLLLDVGLVQDTCDVRLDPQGELQTEEFTRCSYCQSLGTVVAIVNDPANHLIAGRVLHGLLSFDLSDTAVAWQQLTTTVAALSENEDPSEVAFGNELQKSLLDPLKASLWCGDPLATLGKRIITVFGDQFGESVVLGLSVCLDRRDTAPAKVRFSVRGSVDGDRTQTFIVGSDNSAIAEMFNPHSRFHGRTGSFSFL